MNKIALAVLAVAALVVGCGGPKPQPQVDLGFVGGIETGAVAGSSLYGKTEAPAAPTNPGVPERPPYRIGVGDRLALKFIYYSPYNYTVVVRPDGAVTIPYVGEVKAEGMTPLELEGIVRTRYAEILSEPEVSVIVEQSVSQRIFVLGEVRIPGQYDFNGPMTVLDAVAVAGGVTVLGRKDSIVLIRKAPDGSFKGTKLDLESIMDGHEENIDLMARDVVYVPMSRIAKVDLFVNQFFTQISPTLYFMIAGHEVYDPGQGAFFVGQ